MTARPAPLTHTEEARARAVCAGLDCPPDGTARIFATLDLVREGLEATLTTLGEKNAALDATRARLAAVTLENERLRGALGVAVDAIEDADANLPRPDFEQCSDVHVVRVHGEADDYECGGVNCTPCIEQESWDKLESALKSCRAALSPTQPTPTEGNES